MPQLAYITRGNASPQGKPRVYFCCHPADQTAFLQPMAKELLAVVDCSVWYDPEPKKRPPCRSRTRPSPPRNDPAAKQI